MKSKGDAMKVINGILHITEEEYSRIRTGQGVITAEYTSRETPIRRSFMWSRTLRLNKRLYIENYTMVFV